MRCASLSTRPTPSCSWPALQPWTWLMWWRRTCVLPGPPLLGQFGLAFVEPRLTSQVRYCQFSLIWKTDCLRLAFPLSGSTEADTWPDFLYLKWKLQKYCPSDKPKVFDNCESILLWRPIFIKTWLFSYYSSNLVCMLQGVPKFNYDLVFHHRLACSQYFLFLCIQCFCHVIYSICKLKIAP